MDLKLWDKIEFHYKQATKYLWIQKDDPNWHKDTEKGLWHLLSAYNMAKESEEKKHLLYARILIMMHEEFSFCGCNEHNHFYKYVEPAIKEYNLSREIDKKEPTEKEWNKAKLHYDSLKYLIDSTNDNEEDFYRKNISLIENNEGLDKFNFYDSSLVSFELDRDSIFLRLEYCDEIICLSFENIYEVNVNTDPKSDRISEFYCYKQFGFENRIVFDIGFYKIVCEKISVTGWKFLKKWS